MSSQNSNLQPESRDGAASKTPDDLRLTTPALPSGYRKGEATNSPEAGTQDRRQEQLFIDQLEKLVEALAVQQSQRAVPLNSPSNSVQTEQPAPPPTLPPANNSPTWKDATDMKSVNVNQWLKSAQDVADREGRAHNNLPKTTEEIDKLKSRYATYKSGMALCTTVSVVTAVGVAAHFLGMFPGGFTSAAVLAGVGLAAAAANKYFQSNIDNDFDGTVGHECTMALSASTWGEKLTRTATLFHMVRDWNRMPFPSQRLVAFSTGKADQLDTLLEYIHRAGKSAEHWASMEQANGIDGDQYRMFNKPLNDFSADLPRLKSRWGAWPELMLTVSRFSAMAGGIYGVLSLGAVL